MLIVQSGRENPGSPERDSYLLCLRIPDKFLFWGWSHRKFGPWRSVPGRVLFATQPKVLLRSHEHKKWISFFSNAVCRPWFIWFTDGARTCDLCRQNKTKLTLACGRRVDFSKTRKKVSIKPEKFHHFDITIEQFSIHKYVRVGNRKVV